MYIQVKTADCSKCKILEVSKVTSVEELKDLVEKNLGVKPVKQRLFFRGKQLENGYKMHDYSINVNDVIMLMEKIDVEAITPKESSSKTKNADTSTSSNSEVKSQYYKVGDLVEAVDEMYGGWFEGKITAIEKNTDTEIQPTSELASDKDTSDKKNSKTSDPIASSNLLPDDGLLYMVTFDFCAEDPPIGFTINNVRPRMTKVIKFTGVKVGDVVLVNYNIESPKERGYWYDMVVNKVGQKRSQRELVGTIFVGSQRTELDDCKIVFVDEIMKIEFAKSLSERSKADDKAMTTESDVRRKSAPMCPSCEDNPRRKCKECSCHKCGGKDEPDKQLMCDECNNAYHLRCLNPPLETIPDIEEWYCPECKNDENEIVKAGEKLKESKKKAKMPSAKQTSRDWGKGMACAGRTKECTIVRPNHFGPIPGIEVGTLWKFRLTASESGCHRPPVSGIHGRDNEGAYSIVLSGGYEDDIDNGEEFLYTGSGGRDLSGNKRTSEQCCDQTLTRMNLALAKNCNAPVNTESGAEAKDWRGGKPVRVLRNYKLAKHSKYAPEDGNRYDGIYKVVKYYPVKGESGFKVWRYELRRDDPIPPPWTQKGKERIASLGLEMIYPDGYKEMMAAKEQAAGSAGSDEKKTSRKRKSKILSESTEDSPNTKRACVQAYKLEPEISKLVSDDAANKKLWDNCSLKLGEGKTKYLAEVQTTFVCICCQELVFKPITTSCGHNICKVCLQRSFSAKVFTCPYCRNELGQRFDLKVNENLSTSLMKLFPGYEVGR